ncbi:MAG: helix-turn-helix domain-containing protein [Trueperaceae bacterium]|nr:helix-turn-helix domain-containing protein [Trueperaceae bacterium]
MAELEYEPVTHDHETFLARARRRRGFQKASDALETEYQVANELIAARARAGLTQEAVAQRMGTTKSAVSRLESGGKHTPSVGTLQRYAKAVGCEIKIELVPKAG